MPAARNSDWCIVEKKKSGNAADKNTPRLRFSEVMHLRYAPFVHTSRFAVCVTAVGLGDIR